MAMMLIDQTKDSACKTAEADAIRAKTGGSASLAYDWANDKGFADAIAAIPSGGSELQYSQSVIIPSQEYGRAANGGAPKAFEYFYSILPQSWELARLVLLDDPQTAQNYSMYEIASGCTYADVTANSNFTLKRVENGAITTIKPTGSISGWSFIISPDYEYLLEVWS